MKFNCGRETRIKQLLDWHRHFALFPVQTDGDECRWMEWVERKYTWRGSSGAFYDPEYRALREAN